MPPMPITRPGRGGWDPWLLQEQLAGVTITQQQPPQVLLPLRQITVATVAMLALSLGRQWWIRSSVTPWTQSFH